MNIFTENLPESVEVDGVKYPVFTDFRIWTEFESILHMTDIETRDKVMLILNLCFDKEKCTFLPENWESAIKSLSSFYLCGKNAETGSGDMAMTERAFSFSEDSGYIYSAFLTQYGIDLVSIPYMHWYLFRMLFEGLEDRRRIMKIIRWRTCDPDSVQDREKKKYLKKMKEFYRLSPLERSDGELAEILSQAF